MNTLKDIIDINPFPLHKDSEESKIFTERHYDFFSTNMRGMTDKELVNELKRIRTSLNKERSFIDNYNPNSSTKRDYPIYVIKERIKNMEDYESKLIDELERRGFSIKESEE